MRRFRIGLGLLVLLSIILSIQPLVAQETTNPVGGVLQVVESTPEIGQELGLKDSIILYFDHSLDCPSAEQSLEISPSIEGEISCAGSRLSFTPNEDYQSGTVYTVTVNEEARAADGQQLLEPFTISFMTTGALQVTEVFPAESRSVPTDTNITLIFNRPVVPLTTSVDTADLPNPLQISPNVEGKGEWVNTSIYIFDPEEDLSGGTDYTLTVPAGLTSAEGAVLMEDFTTTFRTPDPEITAYGPQGTENGVLLNATVNATFNQEMDRESVEEAFSLETIDNEPIEGTFTWQDDNLSFVFKPDEPLEIATAYVARVEDTAHGVNKDATLLVGERWGFNTIPYPAIESTTPTDGDEDIQPYGGFEVYFASPMNLETVEERITVEPEPRLAPTFYYRDWSNALSVNFPPEPSTTYTITIEAGAEDIYGNTIDTPYTFSYTTGDYGEMLDLKVPGVVGFYNAYRAPTELFLTHLNVSQLDLTLATVPVADFITTVANNGYYDTPTFKPNASNILRQWTIPNVAPKNYMRYELVQPALIAQGDEACAGALPRRVAVGDAVQVINEPDSVRLRTEPTTQSEIIEELYKDAALRIIGGPVCTEDTLLWWNVELTDGRQGWMVESFENEYMVSAGTAPAVTPVTIEDAENDGRLDPGIYFLEVDAPEFRDNVSPAQHYMVVANTLLMVKASVDQATVWATNPQTGEPVGNITVDIYMNLGDGVQKVNSGTTNEDGILQVTTPISETSWTSVVAVVNDEEHFGIGDTSWSNGIEGWAFGIYTDYEPRTYNVYTYTDRPVYRPGQPVYFKAIVRRQDDARYFVPELDTVPVKIQNDRGEIVFEEDMPLTPYGTVSGEFMLSPDAGLGYYNLSIELPKRYEYSYEGGSVGFNVAEYRLPEFKVGVTPVQPEVARDETIEIDVSAEYYFGGMVSNANVNYSVISSPYSFNYTGDTWYDFYDYSYDGGPADYYDDGYGEQVASGTVQADLKGVGRVEVVGDLGDAKGSRVFSIEATVTDESNQSVSGRTDVIVHQSKVYVGARPRRYVATMLNETSFDFIAVDWDSQPVAGQEIEVQIVERRWSSVQEVDPNSGRTNWNWEVEEIPVTEGTVTTDADGLASFTFTPEKGGVYKAIATTRDEDGNTARTATTLWVSSREYVSWRQQNSNRVDLIADKKDYNIGDTAEILITSPFQGTAEAIITVERGDVLKVERVTLDSNSYVYRLPIDETFAPNVYVSVFIVKGVDENNPVAGFRVGFIPLNVETTRKVMNIEISADTDRAQPQEIVTYTLKTTNYAGEPVQAEVGVGVTDQAALAIGLPNSGPLMNTFYSQQALGVRTSTALTINTDQITQETLDTVKGGGGGFAGGGIVDIRGEFIDTPYWNGALVTDENGEVTFDVRLPDNLTTWKLDARAITLAPDGNMLVGQETFDLLSTKPLLIRPVTPRFFIVGDTVLLSAVVNNNTATEQTVKVSLKSAGLVLVDNNAEQTVTIPADGRARVTWQVTVEDIAVVKAAFLAEGDGYNDASISPVSMDDNGSLPVYRYEVPETVGTSGVLRNAENITETIVLPQRFTITEGELTVKVEKSLAATTLSALNVLRNRPWQGIEQTVSRFLPNIMTYRALDDLGVAREGLKSTLDFTVNESIQKLYAEQKADGGWGWYVQDLSDPMVTAYAVLGLQIAQEEGYPISESVLTQARSYLRSKLVTPSPSRARYILDRQVFILYVLARGGFGDVGRTSIMYDYRENLSLYAKAFLAQTLQILNPEDTERLNTLLDDIMSNAVISATGVRWEESLRRYNWSTNLRTTAIIVDTLIKLRPESDLLPGAIRYLIAQRKADAWETTQETAWTVMALTNWMVESGELKPEYGYTVTLNGEELASGNALPNTIEDVDLLTIDVADLLANEANQLMFQRTEGEGALYYTAHLRALMPVPEIEPLNKGIIVERRYLREGSDEPVTEAVVGEVLEVRLTIIAPSALQYVTIEDPLPAGAEAINPNLQTSQQQGTQPEMDRVDPLNYGWGWWYFSNIDFHDEKVTMNSTYLPAGTYEYVYKIRVGIEGQFNVIPTTAQEFYFPEVYGRGAGMLFTVTAE